ncbi:MAG: hypothetical protein IKF38_04025 [Clostridia bacterium]|nr:hypothetical protein [Clostridia bacterium]
MNLILKVAQKEGASMVALTKVMCLLKCRVSINVPDGNITITDMEDSDVERVVDTIGEAFNIVRMDIEPTLDISQPEQPIVTEDSLEFEKIEFKDKEVENQVNKVLRIAYWAMYSGGAKSIDICHYFMTAGKEIAMKYNPKEPVNFSVGDIVDCNYGSHLSGEISGGHIHTIICDIDEDGSIYAVPITKQILEGDETRFLTFSANVDVDYENSQYTGGTLLLKKGRYIHQLRIVKVVGRARLEFFNKILECLPRTFDFSEKNRQYGETFAERVGDVQNDDCMLEFNGPKSVQDVSIAENVEDKTKEKQKLPAEKYLEETFSDVISRLDKDGSPDTKVDTFLEAIGFENYGGMFRDAFVVACNVKKITYGSICTGLNEIYPKLSEDEIKEILRDEFVSWTFKTLDIRDAYPKMNIMALLKLFAKAMR